VTCLPIIKCNRSTNRQGKYKIQKKSMTNAPCPTNLIPVLCSSGYCLPPPNMATRDVFVLLWSWWWWWWHNRLQGQQTASPKWVEKGLMSNCRSNIGEIWALVLTAALCRAMSKYLLCFIVLSLDPEWSLITAPMLDKAQRNRGWDLTTAYGERNSSGRGYTCLFCAITPGRIKR